ncbi:MAG TPA: SUF system Fe-S cluster assembly protein [Thermoanaerobaculia bacterium]|nr:SUF system Fe-S cluster assembly protein [Thermoanaerobaculia bacterium]
MSDPEDSSAPPAVSEKSDSTGPAELETGEIENGIVEALKTVFDPEIPVNIYELGLVYDVDIQPAGKVKISMTLTSPACPVAGSLPGEVQAKVEAVPGVTQAEIDLVWEPAWNPSMMTEAARLQLGMF